MKKNIIILFISFISAYSVAQDAFYTNSMATPLSLNPAFAGSKNIYRLSLNNQLHWFSAIYNTIFNSLSADINYNGIGLGVNMAYNTLSTGFTNADFDLMASYRLGKRIGFTFTPGIKLSYKGLFFNDEKLVFYDQLSVYDGVNAETSAELEKTKFNFLDISAGFTSHFPLNVHRTRPAWVDLGFAYDHIPKLRYSMIGDPLSFYPSKITVHGGVYIPLYIKHKETKLRTTKQIMLYPNFVFRNQGNFSLVSTQIMAYRSPFILGVGYQTFTHINIYSKQQANLTIGFEKLFGKFMAMDFMYNINLGMGLLHNTPLFLSHEFSISVYFVNKRKNDCPENLKWNKQRWYYSNISQQRHKGECPPGRTPRRLNSDIKPYFYPYELPKSLIDF